MGRGAYEHNYTQLNLPELAVQTPDAAPVEVVLPVDLSGPTMGQRRSSARYLYQFLPQLRTREIHQRHHDHDEGDHRASLVILQHPEVG